MAISLGTVQVELRAMAAQFVKQFEDAGEAVADVSDDLRDLRNATGVAAAAMAAAGLYAINAASDFNETSNVIQASFGDAADEVEAWAKTQAQAMGRSTQQMRKFGGEMQAMLSPMMGSREAASGMSTSLSQLAVDLGSFFNVADDDALRALKSGITGEMEPLKRFGIVMNETSLQAFAFARGISKSVSEMGIAEKTALRYEFILSRTKLAQGDAAKTADGFANATKGLKGAFEDLTVSVGQELLPAAESFVAWGRDVLKTLTNVSPQTRHVAVRMAVLATAVLAGVAAVTSMALGVGVLGAALPAIIAGFVAASKAALILAIPLLKIAALLVALGIVVGLVARAWQTNFGGIRDITDDVVTGIGSAVKAIGGALVTAADTVGRFIVDMIFLPLEGIQILKAEIIGVLAAVGQLGAKLGAKLGFDTSGISSWLENQVEGEAALLERIQGLHAEIRDNVSLGDALSSLGGVGTAILDGFKVGGDFLKAALGEVGEGWAFLLEAAFGKATEQAKAAAVVLDPLDTGGGKPPTKSELKARVNAAQKIDDIYRDAIARTAQLTSEFSDLQAVANDWKATTKELDDAFAVAKVSSAAYAVTADAVAEATGAEWAEKLNNIRESQAYSAALVFVREKAEELGIAFDKVEKNLAKKTFASISSSGGPGLSGLIAGGLFGLSGTKADDADASSKKAAAENAGDVLSGALTSGSIGLGGIGSMLGGAIGSAAPAIGTAAGAAIGGVVGGVLESALGEFGKAFGVIAEQLSSIVLADPRMKGFVEVFAGVAGPIAMVSAAYVTLMGILTALAVVANIVTLMALGPLGILLLILATVVFVAILAFVMFAGVVFMVATGMVWLASVMATWSAALILGPAAILGFTAGLLFLTKETDRFKIFMGAMGAVMDTAIAPLEQFAFRLLSLVGLFAVFLDVFLPIIEAFGQSEAMAELLFMVLKNVAIGIAAFAIAVMTIANVVNMVASGLLFGMAGFVSIAASIMEAMGLDAEALEDFADGLETTGNALSDMIVDTGPMRDALSNLEDLEFVEAIRAGQEFADALDDVSDDVGTVASSFQGLNEQLLNAPEGMRVDRARYRSLGSGAPPMNPAGEGAGGVPMMTVQILGDWFLTSMDPEDQARRVVEAIDKQKMLVHGNPGAVPYQRG